MYFSHSLSCEAVPKCTFHIHCLARQFHCFEPSSAKPWPVQPKITTFQDNDFLQKHCYNRLRTVQSDDFLVSCLESLAPTWSRSSWWNGRALWPPPRNRIRAHVPWVYPESSDHKAFCQEDVTWLSAFSRKVISPSEISTLSGSVAAENSV